MIKIAIIEDREKDIKLLKQILLADGRFSLHHTLINGLNWKTEMQTARFDVLFADIELNGKNVFDLIKTLSYKPEIVIITNYPKYALQAFASDVIHYITKPLRKEHILTAIERVHRKVMLKEHRPVPESFFIQVGRNKYEQIFFNQLISVHSESEYVRFNLYNEKPIMVYERLKNILAELPGSHFIQVHRSAIVNIKYIRSVDGSSLHLINKEKVPVGASYKSRLALLINK